MNVTFRWIAGVLGVAGAIVLTTMLFPGNISDPESPALGLVTFFVVLPGVALARIATQEWSSSLGRWVTLLAAGALVPFAFHLHTLSTQSQVLFRALALLLLASAYVWPLALWLRFRFQGKAPSMPWIYAVPLSRSIPILVLVYILLAIAWTFSQGDGELHVSWIAGNFGIIAFWGTAVIGMPGFQGHKGRITGRSTHSG